MKYMKRPKNFIDLRDLIILGSSDTSLNNIKVSGGYICPRKDLHKSLLFTSFIDDTDMRGFKDVTSIEDRLILTKSAFMIKRILYRNETWGGFLSGDENITEDLNKCTSWNKLCHYYLGRIIGIKEYKDRLYELTLKILVNYVRMTSTSDDLFGWIQDGKVVMSCIKLFNIYKLDKEKLMYEFKLSIAGTLEYNAYHKYDADILIHLLHIIDWNNDNDLSEAITYFGENISRSRDTAPWYRACYILSLGNYSWDRGQIDLFERLKLR